MSQFEIFKERKKSAIRNLLEAIKNNEVDKPIEKELLKINEYEIVYSTSSCAGRIALLVDKGNKKDSFFIGKWHEKVNAEEIIKNLKENIKNDLIWFKQEPFIIHLVFPKIKFARDVLKIARDVGFKHSGIISLKKEKIVLEVTGLDRIDFPIVINSEFTISLENFIKIVDLANSKMIRNAILRQKFFKYFFEYLEKNSKKEITLTV
ncbi:MAG: hypothetical protein QW678_00790 [Candidatus Aenigmatarchaeota archaeon]